MTSTTDNQKKSPTVYANRFEVVKLLGEGSSGIVDLVLDQRARSLRLLACKRIPVDSETSLKHAKNEVLIMKVAQKGGFHDNLVRIFGYYYNEGSTHLSIMMEYCERGELADQIVSTKGVCSPALAYKYFSQLLQGVDFLHKRGIAHRDIKTENMFLTKRGDVKLGDFGWSIMFRTSKGTKRLTSLCGTMPYISPQVLEKNYRADAADVWSCGIVLFVLLCGQEPWESATEEDANYLSWVNNPLSKSTEKPWKNLQVNAFCLLRQILAEDEEERLSIEEIFAHCSMKSITPTKS